MSPPMLSPISCSEIKITWIAPDPVKELAGHVTMYQIVLAQNNSLTNPFAPELEDKVRSRCKFVMLIKTFLGDLFWR